MSQRYLTGAYDDTWNPGTYAFWDIDPIVVNYKGTMIVLHVVVFSGEEEKAKEKKTYSIHCYCLLLPIHWNGILRLMLTFPARIYGTPNEFIYFHVTGDRIRESIFGSIFSRCLYRWLQYDRGVYRLLLHTRPVHHLLAGDSGCISLARISPQHPDGRYTFPFSFGLWCVGLTNFFCSVHFTLWLTSYPSSHLNKFVRHFKIRCC